MLAATTHTALADTSTTATSTTATSTDEQLLAPARTVHHLHHLIRHRRHRAVRLARSLGIRYRPHRTYSTDIDHLRHVAHTLRKRNRHYRALRRRLFPKLRCIHHYEGAWNAYNAAGPYYGGFQMDSAFMQRWGADKLRKYGGADARSWSARDQMAVASRAARHIGFGSWPHTAAICGLL
jgi:hypothetical protein